LEEVLSVDIISIPKKQSTLHNANTTKHRRYYYNYGHTTEDCYVMKDKIEELYTRGR